MAFSRVCFGDVLSEIQRCLYDRTLSRLNKEVRGNFPTRIHTYICDSIARYTTVNKDLEDAAHIEFMLGILHILHDEDLSHDDDIVDFRASIESILQTGEDETMVLNVTNPFQHLLLYAIEHIIVRDEDGVDISDTARPLAKIALDHFGV